MEAKPKLDPEIAQRAGRHQMDLAMADAWWDSLSDSEIRARLTNRGVSEGEARHCAYYRDRDPRIRLFIKQVLGAE